MRRQAFLRPVRRFHWHRRRRAQIRASVPLACRAEHVLQARQRETEVIALFAYIGACAQSTGFKYIRLRL